MRIKSNVVINGIPARDLVEDLRPIFMGRAVARASDMRDILNDRYSAQGKHFTEESVLRLWQKAGAESSLMLEANGYVQLLDQSKNHSLWCTGDTCPKCNPPEPEEDYRASPEFITAQRAAEEQEYNFNPSDTDTGVVDADRQLAEDKERQRIAFTNDLDRQDVVLDTNESAIQLEQTER